MHPVPVLAIVVLLLNDHWWKFAFTGWWTGKISDFAGMVFFPLLLQAFVELVDRREPFRPRRSQLIGCALATGLVFGSTNVSAFAADAYRVGLGWIQWPFRVLGAIVRGGAVPEVSAVHLTQDPSDVIAVPFVLVAVWVGWKRSRSPEAP